MCKFKFNSYCSLTCFLILSLSSSLTIPYFSDHFQPQVPYKRVPYKKNNVYLYNVRDNKYVTFHAIWSTLYFCSIHTSEDNEFLEINVAEKCIFIETTRILRVVSIKNTLLHNSYLRVLT